MRIGRVEWKGINKLNLNVEVLKGRILLTSGDIVTINIIVGSWQPVTCTLMCTLNHDRAQRGWSAFHIIKTVQKYY